MTLYWTIYHLSPQLPTLLSELQFGALLVYSPRGASEVSAKSRTVCYDLKRGKQSVLDRASTLLAQYVYEGHELARLFGDTVTLVPAPRSSPLPAGAMWPAQRICETLLASKLASSVEPLLERTEAVPKAAFAALGERPSVDRHYATMNVQRDLIEPSDITLVDDVITQGRTSIAAASRLAECFPQANVRVFAMVRTMGLVPEVDRIVDPCLGRIWMEGLNLNRDP